MKSSIKVEEVTKSNFASKISSIGLKDSEMGATLLRKSRLSSNEVFLQIGKPEDLEVGEGINILEDKSEM